MVWGPSNKEADNAKENEQKQTTEDREHSSIACIGKVTRYLRQ
jgi:hypothetical protein